MHWFHLIHAIHVPAQPVLNIRLSLRRVSGSSRLSVGFAHRATGHHPNPLTSHPAHRLHRLGSLQAAHEFPPAALSALLFRVTLATPLRRF